MEKNVWSIMQKRHTCFATRKTMKFISLRAPAFSFQYNVIIYTSHNTTIQDENPSTCVEIPLYNETEGVHKLFSLSIGGNCVNNSRIVVSMHLNTMTTGITCGQKIGILTHDSTHCDGLTACKVRSKIFVHVSF